ncbi:MAG: SGNH/GDSL hydrolase family protein [Clostridia bacterium]|nr:SGNH/GDSL hydrolase family protein [Clostridia bacterium]
MKKVLFLGDSITDAVRSYSEDEHNYIGQGYALIAGGQLSIENPGEYQFTNKGISGNRIVDLYARIKKDCWNLQPDYVSILIGVNDVMHELEIGNGVDAERFEHIYRTLIKETLERLPECKIMLMEPFCLHGVCTDPYYDIFRSEVEKRASIVKQLAEEFKLVFVPFQEAFDKMSAEFGVECWCKDGVHPTIGGHAFMAEKWLEGFAEL